MGIKSLQYILYFITPKSAERGHGMRYLFVINPTAGKRDAGAWLTPQIQRAAAAAGVTAEIVRTTHAGHARQLAAQAAAGGEEVRLYACGGDGTLNELLQSAVGCPHLAVGCIPCGSGNDYVRNFPRQEAFLNLEAQLRAAAVPVDAIRTPFGCGVDICAAGLDAQVAYGIPKFRRLPFCGGSMAYTLSIAETAFSRYGHRLRLTLDDRVLEGEYMLAALCNGRLYGGGYLAAPHAAMDDGLLDVVLVRPMPLPRVLRFLTYYRKGGHLPQDGAVLEKYRGELQFFRVRRVELQVLDGQPIVTTLDGECAPRMELWAEVAPGQLRILLPEAVMQARPNVISRSLAAAY